VSMNVSLDGFMAGVNGGLEWHFKYWNNEMAQAAAEKLSEADTILLGRVTYLAMAKYWPAQAINVWGDREAILYADMMNNHKKIVFTGTLINPEWNNTRLVKRNIKSEIERLKQQDGKNLILYGSGGIVTALNQLDLVDEYQIWIHPVVLGKGKPLFKGLKKKFNMLPLSMRQFSSGVVLICYAVKKNPAEKSELKVHLSFTSMMDSRFPSVFTLGFLGSDSQIPSTANL
ncbi:MAG TPA: dihydrofolate reductase family protein, partial [Chitinophagaceae bacterium]